MKKKCFFGQPGAPGQAGGEDRDMVLKWASKIGDCGAVEKPRNLS
jgi:hypothetical protein